MLLVSIADAQGRVLAQRFKDGHQVASPGSSFILAQEHVEMLAPSITDLSIHYHVVGEQEVYHAAAPVETTEATPGKLATAMVLLGTGTNPESVTLQRRSGVAACKSFSRRRARRRMFDELFTGIG